MHFVHIERTPLGDFYKCHAAASQMPDCRFFTMHPDAEADTTVCEWFGIDITDPAANASTCHAIAARLEALSEQLNREATS